MRKKIKLMDDVTSVSASISMLSGSMQQQSLGGQITGKTIDVINQADNKDSNDDYDFQKAVLSDAMGIEAAEKSSMINLIA